jgi:ribosomal protein S6
MKHRYECLMAIDTRGQEDGLKEIVERLEAEFTKEGAEIEQVQKMDKRPLAYSPRHRLLREFYL